MATRSIVTSQPVLSCDMCGRRLLRGEHPEAFLAGGEQRTVCELCAPRAAHEGWVRETDIDDSLMLRPARRRPGVSLLGRLRQLREPVQRQPTSELDARGPLDAPGPGDPPNPPHEPDLSDEALEGLVERTWGSEHAGGAEDAGGFEHAGGAEDAGDPGLQRALDVFNGGEYPRRMGGVARSLGPPAVTVRPVEGSASRFTIVVAWELCWYRYEVNLDDEPPGASLLEKGLELGELPAEDRSPNAAADERGELELAA